MDQDIRKAAEEINQDLYSYTGQYHSESALRDTIAKHCVGKRREAALIGSRNDAVQLSKEHIFAHDELKSKVQEWSERLLDEPEDAVYVAREMREACGDASQDRVSEIVDQAMSSDAAAKLSRATLAHPEEKIVYPYLLRHCPKHGSYPVGLSCLQCAAGEEGSNG